MFFVCCFIVLCVIFLGFVGFLGAFKEGCSVWAIFWSIFITLIIFFSFCGFYDAGKQDMLNSKICPQCYSFYSKEDSYCLEDGAKLNFIVPEEAKEKYN